MQVPLNPCYSGSNPILLIQHRSRGKCKVENIRAPNHPGFKPEQFRQESDPFRCWTLEAEGKRQNQILVCCSTGNPVQEMLIETLPILSKLKRHDKSKSCSRVLEEFLRISMAGPIQTHKKTYRTYAIFTCITNEGSHHDINEDPLAKKGKKKILYRYMNCLGLDKQEEISTVTCV